MLSCIRTRKQGKDMIRINYKWYEYVYIQFSNLILTWTGLFYTHATPLNKRKLKETVTSEGVFSILNY